MTNRPPVEGDAADPPNHAQTGDPARVRVDLTAAYTAAHKAFMAHVKDCYACRWRGTDCHDVGALKARLRGTRSAGIAARTAAR
ncbi:hypothetical protein ACFRK5_16390 [Streptomyces niveus]|uniref:hypothetical protein n=1 Tax=Streptomyces niveus TaxID=193462 RepID=UPI0036CCF0E3